MVWTGKLTAAILAIAAISCLAGCATLMHGSTQTVNIQTTPPGATCRILEVSFVESADADVNKIDARSPEEILQARNAGNAVRFVERFVVSSPAAISLDRGHGYDVECSNESFRTRSAIRAESSGWLWGNILYGGIPGLIVDYMSGAWNNLAPEVVALTLQPK